MIDKNHYWMCVLCHRTYVSLFKTKIHMKHFHRTKFHTPLVVPIYRPALDSNPEVRGRNVSGENRDLPPFLKESSAGDYCSRCLEKGHPCKCERVRLKGKGKL